MSRSPLQRLFIGTALLGTLLGCGNKETPAANHVRIAEETLAQASLAHFEYTRNMDAAKTGDESAIRQLFRFAGRVDAAGSLGHGVALVDLFGLIGEDKPARVAMALSSEEKKSLFRVLEAGVAYGFLTGPEEFPRRFPKVYSTLHGS